MLSLVVQSLLVDVLLAEPDMCVVIETLLRHDWIRNLVVTVLTIGVYNLTGDSSFLQPLGAQRVDVVHRL